MRSLKNILLIMTAILLMGFATAYAGVSFSITMGSGDYYQPVGDYDYLPYAYQTNPGYAPPTVNFHDMMGQYGVWVSVSPFGQVWKPYASNDWRPYTYGHWVSTQQYGQMWEGYEPWAWAGYHYGNWIFDRHYGWVWIPGYQWHAGRVTWARSYDSIGWMPSPPNGYDYSRGYLSNMGTNNQFGYNDNDFDNDFGSGNFYQGGPYNDPRYRNMYYNPGYNSVLVNLWVFIDNAHYGSDNYANYRLGSDYTRHVFDRRMIRISNRQIDRSVMERLTGQQIRETPVEVRELKTNKQTIQVVVPKGNDAVERVRMHSKEIVREIIAPGFAEKQKEFKGQNSKNKDEVTRIFKQEKVVPKVENVPAEKIQQQAQQASQAREQERLKRDQAQKEKLDKIYKEKSHQADTSGAKVENVPPQDTSDKVKKDEQQKSNDKNSKSKSKDKDKDKDKPKDENPN